MRCCVSPFEAGSYAAMRCGDRHASRRNRQHHPRQIHPDRNWAAMVDNTSLALWLRGSCCPLRHPALLIVFNGETLRTEQPTD